MLKGYQLEYKVTTHTKSEIYQYSRQFNLPGSITSTREGNIRIEFWGHPNEIRTTLNQVRRYLKTEQLITHQEIPKLTYKATVLLIG